MTEPTELEDQMPPDAFDQAYTEALESLDPGHTFMVYRLPDGRCRWVASDLPLAREVARLGTANGVPVQHSSYLVPELEDS
jgi:hypothetical protein